MLFTPHSIPNIPSILKPILILSLSSSLKLLPSLKIFKLDIFVDDDVLDIIISKKIIPIANLKYQNQKK